MDLQTFLKTVLSLIQHNQSGASGLNAAKLGNLIRSDAGLDWIDHGFPKLSDVLRQLETEGKIRLVKDQRAGLLVYPATEPNAATGRTLDTPASPINRLVKPLKSAVWHAFVDNTSPKRLLNRRTAEVWLTADTPPPPTDDWVSVDPVPTAEQRRWAQEFAIGSGLANDEQVTGAIARDDWYRALPQILTTKSASLAIAWNRKRSEHIVQHAVAWAERLGVAPDLLFGVWKGDRDAPKSEDSKQPPELRTMLLSAVGRMTTDELLSVAIPARHVVAALRPDLLRFG